MEIKTAESIAVKCYHCGENCTENYTEYADKPFCCEGCKQVFLLLSENELCVYYDFQKNPGIKTKGKFISDRFAYLDDETVLKKLIQFTTPQQTNVTFSLPQIHCSSCIYLLENLHKVDAGVILSQTNFQRKELFVTFNPQLTSLRKVVELLAFIGYEPSISLNDLSGKPKKLFNRKRIYKIGIAGFCFANIMMLSFPDYFSSGLIEQKALKETFTWLSLFLSLPVLFYSASDFFISAWKGLQQKFLNIDAPIVLAIIVTYSRSYYEIFSGLGTGYLDSGTGIVFFMLIGRWFQDKTYDSFSFDRDYRSYFPLGVMVRRNHEEKNIPVTQLKKEDRILVRNAEMVPADAILVNGNAQIDYSFVNGENTPVRKTAGELIYAGGRQIGSMIELQAVGEVSQSYITQLWNNNTFYKKKNEEKSFIHPWSRYFTLALFTIALGTFIFWWINDPAKILPAASAVLIVACPCSLLLSATFTFGNMLRIFGKNKLYLKNANVIAAMAKINSVVLDKTGTLTKNNTADVQYEGTPLTKTEWAVLKTVTKQSAHPLSKIIYGWLADQNEAISPLVAFEEFPGKGLSAKLGTTEVKLGSADFLREFSNNNMLMEKGTCVLVMINGVYAGKFLISNQYRDGIKKMANDLKKNHFSISVLSGDNDTEQENLLKIMGKDVQLHFNKTPQEKLEYVKQQQKNKYVLMLGDGLNDAGALLQSDVGIAVSDNTAQFSPACDAILEGSKVNLLHRFMGYAKSGKRIVRASFVVSILYNLVGLFFAVQGNLSPMIAAILMPASSISIVLLVSLLSTLSARRKGLQI